MALLRASFLMARISSLDGEGMMRSTTSRTMDRATPMDEMTSAFSGMEYLTPILLLKYTIREAAPPPTPTRDIWSFSSLYFSASSSITGSILAYAFSMICFAMSSTVVPQ